MYFKAIHCFSDEHVLLNCVSTEGKMSRLADFKAIHCFSDEHVLLNCVSTEGKMSRLA